MTELKQVYVCEICGNITEVLSTGMVNWSVVGNRWICSRRKQPMLVGKSTYR